MALAEPDRAYFCILRWVKDPKRDEAKNLAVLLVEPEGKFGGIKAASLAQVAPRLATSGIVDAFIGSLEQQFSEEKKPTLGEVTGVCDTLDRSLQLTRPAPTAVVKSPEITLQALYKAYVAVEGGGPQGVTKGRLKGRVGRAFESAGHAVERDAYVGDFLVDIVVSDAQRPLICEVFAFANPGAHWDSTEREAAHFLYGLQQLDRPAFGLYEPPNRLSRAPAHKAFERVQRWFEKDEVPLRPASEALTAPDRFLAGISG